jgi:hypothetical protein
LTAVGPGGDDFVSDPVQGALSIADAGGYCWSATSA